MWIDGLKFNALANTLFAVCMGTYLMGSLLLGGTAWQGWVDTETAATKYFVCWKEGMCAEVTRWQYWYSIAHGIVCGLMVPAVVVTTAFENYKARGEREKT
jgi:hypothetical protein